MIIKSSWKEDKPISCIVTECSEIPDDNLIDLLSDDGCVGLTKPKGCEVGDCTLSISSSADLKLDSGAGGCSYRSALILSEAKIVEIFVGKHKEYFHTAHGELVTVIEDIKIYKIAIHFDYPLTCIFLNFKGFCDANSLWIFRIFLKTILTPDRTFNNIIQEMLSNELVSQESNKCALSQSVHNFFDTYKAYHNLNDFKLLPFKDPTENSDLDQSCTDLKNIFDQISPRTDSNLARCTKSDEEVLNSEFSLCTLEDQLRNKLSTDVLQISEEYKLDNSQTLFLSAIDKLIDKKLANYESRIIIKMEDLLLKKFI